MFKLIGGWFDAQTKGGRFVKLQEEAQVCQWIINFFTLISQNCEDRDRQAFYGERAVRLLTKMTQSILKDTQKYDEKRELLLNTWHSMRKFGICNQTAKEVKAIFMRQEPQTALDACRVFDAVGYGNFGVPEQQYLNKVLSQMTVENLKPEISVLNAHEYLQMINFCLRKKLAF